MQTLVSLLANFRFMDLVDIVLVSIAFFLLFTIIRQSRSAQAMRGLMLTAVGGLGLYLAAQGLGLTATSRLLESFWIIAVLIFLIVFQNELKKALSEVGRLPLFSQFFAQQTTGVEEIIVAATRMAEKKVGALICLQRKDTLQQFADLGTEMDARVSVELIRTVFSAYTPLHDGAIIIKNNRITAAACLLPLSENANLPKDLGTRHRAALGLTELTDAVVVVCSEETGIISLAVDGRLERPETGESLRVKLRALFEIEEEGERGEGND